jgi:hypothetical protein
MGTWGPGNFENDCAADHLYEVCGPLLKQVEEAMKDPSSLAPDEYDADVVTANLEIIACLSEHLGRYERGELQDFLYPCVLPPPETVAEWKQKYLAVWDANIDGLDPDADYKKTRREVIIDTFDRVERLARGRYEGRAYPDVRSQIADQLRSSDQDSAEPGAAPDLGGS